MLYEDNYFAISVELDFCQRQTNCIDDQHKVESVTDHDNEFTECQTPRKKLQSIGISSVSLHTFMKTLNSDISGAYKVQGACWTDSGSDSYDENDMKEKENKLVRLQNAMQKI